MGRNIVGERREGAQRWWDRVGREESGEREGERLVRKASRLHLEDREDSCFQENWLCGLS